MMFSIDVICGMKPSDLRSSDEKGDSLSDRIARDALGLIGLAGQEHLALGRRLGAVHGAQKTGPPRADETVNAEDLACVDFRGRFQ